MLQPKSTKRKKIRLQEKINGFARQSPTPRSISPNSPYQRSNLDISEHSNRSLKVSKKNTKKAKFSIAYSKLSIIKTPVKMPSTSPNTSLLKKKPMNIEYIPKIMHGSKMFQSKLQNYERTYRVSSEFCGSSYRSFSKSARESYKFLSNQEYFPDLDSVPKDAIFPLRTFTEYFSLQYCLKNHRNSVNSISLFNDILFTGSADYTVKSWKLPPVCFQPYREMDYIPGQIFSDSNLEISHKRPVNSITSNNGDLFTSSQDNTIKVKRLHGQSNKILTKVPAKCLEVLPNSLISGDLSSITQYDYLKFQIFAKWDTQSVSHLAKNAENIFFSGHSNGQVKIWDVRTGKVSKEIICHGDVVTGIDSMEFGFGSCSEDGTAKFWDIRNHCEVMKYYTGTRLKTIKINSDRIVTGGDFIRIWEDDLCFELAKYRCKDIINLKNCVIAACDIGTLLWNIDKQHKSR